jgi:hypothetical protein
MGRLDICAVFFEGKFWTV